jgi:hypothetical protein
VVEFLLLTLPLFGLASATLGVTWYSYAKGQVLQVANEAAMQLNEPDSTELEVFDDVKLKLRTRLGIDSFSVSNYSNTSVSVSAIAIELPSTPLLGPFSLLLPPLSVVSSVSVVR